MLLKEIINFLSYFLMFNSIEASSFQSIDRFSSFEEINETQDETFYKISKKLYPSISIEILSLLQDGVHHDLFEDVLLPNKEIDLSKMELERIPLILVSKMKNIEKLDLSHNPNLKIHEQWFQNLSTNLKELSMSNCDLNDKNLDACFNLKLKLEKLNISKNPKLKVNSFQFISILWNLKHLDI